MRTRILTNRRGQIVVLAPIVLVVLLAIVALASDVGHIAVSCARLQNVADSAALAAAHELLSRQAGGEAESAARTGAQEAALALREANWPEAGLDVEFGTLDEYKNFTAADESTKATAVRCLAARDDTAPGGRLDMFFAPMLAVDDCEAARKAVAEATNSICGVTGGLSPFAVPQASVPDPGQEITFYPADDNEYDGIADESVAPGCWGLLNLDGGSTGTTELRDWILNGYSGPLALDSETDHLWIDGTSGFRSALEKSILERIGEPMIVVIFDQVTGTGSTADFRCVGFVRVTITAVDLHSAGTDAYVRGTVEKVAILPDLISGFGLPSPNIYKVQLVD